MAAACNNRQDPAPNTAANQPPPGYGAPGYGAPPGGAPGYGAPPGGYGTPPPAGYGNTPPPGYGNAPPPAPGYGSPPPTPIGQPPVAPTPQPNPTPAPGSPSPAPTAPTGLPSGFPWPFPAPGGTTPPGGSPSPAGGGSSGSATPIDPNLASVATVPLIAYSQQEAPGMTREGGVVAGQFKEGQTLEQPMQLMPGKCYTVLAVGAGIQEVDITIVAVTPIPQASGILAQDNGSGSSASLGGKGQCFKWGMPFGINGKFVIKATRGAGIAAGQLYSK